MSTILEDPPQPTDQEPVFLVDKDIYSWEEIKQELNNEGVAGNGLMVAAITADMALLDRSVNLTAKTKTVDGNKTFVCQELINDEIKRSRDKLPAGDNLNIANTDNVDKETFFSNVYNAAIAGIKPAISAQEKQLFLDDFEQFNNKPSYEQKAAARAAQIRVLGLKPDQEIFDDEATDLLKTKLEQMQDEDDPVEDIIAYAADMKIAGIKGIKLPTSIIQRAVDQLYRLQDDRATPKFRHLGANLAVLVRKDILSQLGLE
ncbi:MAG: hypothetical protein Q8P73_05090 [bacterium]|nr:hypothetical protein [bacterium]MDZ4342317.1 hypothetical protein [Candidatus Binatia bacterium]